MKDRLINALNFIKDILKRIVIPSMIVGILTLCGLAFNTCMYLSNSAKAEQTTDYMEHHYKDWETDLSKRQIELDKRQTVIDEKEQAEKVRDQMRTLSEDELRRRAWLGR